MPRKFLNALSDVKLLDLASKLFQGSTILHAKEVTTGTNYNINNNFVVALFRRSLKVQLPSDMSSTGIVLHCMVNRCTIKWAIKSSSEGQNYCHGSYNGCETIPDGLILDPDISRGKQSV